MAVIARCGASRDALGLLTAIVGVDDRFRRVKASLIQVLDDQSRSVSWRFLPAASIRKLPGIPLNIADAVQQQGSGTTYARGTKARPNGGKRSSS